MYCPMLKHGIDQLRIRLTPLSVLGTSGGPSWAQALVSPRMSLNKCPRPYAIPKNIIIHSKHDASARTTQSTVSLIQRAQSQLEVVQKL